MGPLTCTDCLVEQTWSNCLLQLMRGLEMQSEVFFYPFWIHRSVQEQRSYTDKMLVSPFIYSQAALGDFLNSEITSETFALWSWMRGCSFFLIECLMKKKSSRCVSSSRRTLKTHWKCSYTEGLPGYLIMSSMSWFVDRSYNKEA